MFENNNKYTLVIIVKNLFSLSGPLKSLLLGICSGFHVNNLIWFVF